MIKYYEGIIPYITIENFYDDRELDQIWLELDFLCEDKKLLSPEESGSAQADFKNLKSNRSIWLDDFYSDRRSSNILEVNRKLFSNNSQIYKGHPFWGFSNFDCRLDTTLISYYENSDYYEPHVDRSHLTCLTWFYKEPKKFTGGDLSLIYQNYKVDITLRNNFTVIFPSLIYHSVSKVIMNEKDVGKKYGRFCMTQFLHHA